MSSSRAAAYQVLDGSQSQSQSRTWDVEVVFTDSEEEDDGEGHSESEFEIEDDLSPDDDMQPVLPSRHRSTVPARPALAFPRPDHDPPPLRAPRAVTFVDAPPPSHIEAVLSRSDRSVKYRVDQHRDYYAATQAASSDSNSSGSVESRPEASTSTTASSSSTSLSTPPEPFSLRKWIMSTWIGDRLQVTDKTTLLVMIAICVILVLMIIAVCGFGIAVIAEPNAREVRVQDYNQAVVRFEQSATISEASPLLPTFFTGAAAVLRLSGSASATTLSFNAATSSTLALKRVPVQVLGTTGDVTPATTVYLTAPSVAVSTSSTMVVSFQLTVAPSTTPTLLSVSVQSVVTADDQAPSSVLELSHDPGAPQYVSSVCIVVRINQLTGLAELTDQISCYYPFGKWQQYSLTQSKTIPVEVRLESDPYVVLQDETQGTTRFSGKSRAEQNLEGGMAIGVSLVFAIPLMVLLVPALVEWYSRRYRLLSARKARDWVGRKDRDTAVSPQVLVRSDDVKSGVDHRAPGLRMRRSQLPRSRG